MSSLVIIFLPGGKNEVSCALVAQSSGIKIYSYFQLDLHIILRVHSEVVLVKLTNFKMYRLQVPEFPRTG